MFMALSQIIWSLDEKKPLDSAALTEEKELENLLCNNIEILNRDWLVVKNQVKTAAGKYIDILCMDHDGDMVVIEFKKDQTPREVTAQVIDYAASVSKMNAQDIAQLYLDFSRGNETLNSAYKQKFSTELDEDSVNQKVKVTDIAKQAKDATFNIEGEEKAMSGLPLMGKYFNINDNEEQAEYIVKVCWINTVEKAKAVSELGFFGNQNSVCRPSAERWDFTVSRLKKIWNIADE